MKAALLVLALASHGAAPAKKVTYAGNVAAILNAHCISCHRPGQVAPFSLIGYENAKKWSGMVAQVVTSGQMPPWKAAAGYGEFRDANRLTADELKTLQDWASNSAPRGDAAHEPKPPVFPTGSEWALGKPDLILEPSSPYHLAADGADVYRNFVLKAKADKPLWVKAIDVRPGNFKVVHHVIIFLDRSHSAERLESKSNDGQEGYTTSGGGVGFLPSGSLGGWAPGLIPRVADPGVAFRVDPGENIVLQVHYHKSGKPESDQTRVALYLAKEPITKELEINWLFNFGIDIPAGDAAYTSRRTFTWPRAATLYGAMPHMHLIGRSMKSWLEFPDGTTQPLIDVPHWDFNWQLLYGFAKPIHIPAGTKQVVEAVYDNSTGNPNNPNSPPREVRWGEQTTDEMFLMIMPYTLDKGDDQLHTTLARRNRH